MLKRCYAKSSQKVPKLPSNQPLILAAMLNKGDKMATNTFTFIDQIERLYGKYADAEIRQDVGRLLLRRYDDHLETLAQVMDAIKESCPIRFGPPDVATISGAVRTFEDIYGRRLIPPTMKTHAPPPETIAAAKCEMLVNLAPLAEAMGIDTRKDGWLVAYCMAEVERKKRLTSTESVVK